MAKKYDCDIDTSGFIENFRATDDPTASLGRESPITPSAINEVKTPEPKPSATAANNISSDEYRQIFVDDLKYRYHDTRYPAIEIYPDFISRIDEIKAACRKRRCTMSSFINNVLEQHFKDYESQINELLNRKE